MEQRIVRESKATRSRDAGKAKNGKTSRTGASNGVREPGVPDLPDAARLDRRMLWGWLHR